ncbi:MAG: class I SAM-dependent methyltransferase [Nitrospirota bacterium]
MENFSMGMRKSERRPFSQTISCYLNVFESTRERKWLNLQARAIDVSDRGIGILTEYPLSPGYILWFNDGSGDRAGFVVWCTKLDAEYRAGVKIYKKYVEDLDEQTDIFINNLEDIEKTCSNPDANPAEILKAIDIAFSDVLSSCEEFEQKVKDERLIREAQIRFRERTNPILSKSYCINRARTWPQGHQGDYLSLEVVYKNTPLSDGIGHYLDFYMLNFPFTHSIRNRINKLEDILREEINKRQKPNVLNIACGSCREVFRLSPEIEKTGANFTCIDLDDDALSFAANRLSHTNISPLFSNQVNFRKYNALRMFDNELIMSEFGKQDIIYSVGFFDYLPSNFLSIMLYSLYNSLNPGGVLIASFKDARQYDHRFFHWIVDWDGFLQRTEEDFWIIFSDADIPYSAITQTREDSGVIVFYIITK